MRQAANPATPADAVDVFDAATDLFSARARPSSPQARNLQRRPAELRAQLAATTHTSWGPLQPGRAGMGFLRSLGDEAIPAADDPDLMTTCWLVPTSMRSVDAESGARAIRHTKSVAHPAATAAAGVGESAGEDLF